MPIPAPEPCRTPGSEGRRAAGLAPPWRDLLGTHPRLQNAAVPPHHPHRPQALPADPQAPGPPGLPATGGRSRFSVASPARPAFQRVRSDCATPPGEAARSLVHCVASVTNETCETAGEAGSVRIGRVGRVTVRVRVARELCAVRRVFSCRTLSGPVWFELQSGCPSTWAARQGGSALPPFHPRHLSPKHSVTHKGTLGDGRLLLLGASRCYPCAFAPARSQLLRDSSLGSIPKSVQKGPFKT